LAVELQQAATGGDGADSTLFSSDEDEEEPRKNKKKARAPANDDSDEEDYQVDDDEDGLSVAESERPSKFVRKPEAVRSAADAMAAAAFGGTSQLFGENSDEESMLSQTSSKRKKNAYKATFPVKGVTCVGCAAANKIGPVERFVNSNIGKMSDKSLWKMAALTWKLDVVEPAKREGVEVVDWKWRDIANHFKLHTTNSTVGRTSMIATLSAMRHEAESRLVRVENGERELDKTNAELILKLISAESRERALLSASQAGSVAGRGKGGQKPAGEE
jgi:hypothetical protein